jgi:calcium-dependent protein kinase
MKNVVGTMFYIAPEVFQQHYTYHCDMWSIGVVMFIMLFGFPPFHGSNDQVTQRRILAGFRPEVRNGYGAFFPASIPVSHEAMDLIRRLLDSDPALRLSAAEALEHPWLRDPTLNSGTPLATATLTNLGNFQSSCRFKQVVLSALSSALDDSDIDDLQKAFKEFDIDGDGTLTADELKEVLAKSVGDNEKLERHVNALLALDVDGDGAISYDELVMASVQKKLAAKEERLVNVFTALDVNGDGKVTPEEIEQVLSGFMDDTDDIIQMIREVDTDGDGAIDYDEFVTMFMDNQATQRGLLQR